jgi:hypothetical protein
MMKTKQQFYLANYCSGEGMVELIEDMHQYEHEDYARPVGQIMLSRDDAHVKALLDMAWDEVAAVYSLGCDAAATFSAALCDEKFEPLEEPVWETAGWDDEEGHQQWYEATHEIVVHLYAVEALTPERAALLIQERKAEKQDELYQSRLPLHLHNARDDVS